MESTDIKSNWSLNILQQDSSVLEALNRLNKISDTLQGRPLTLLIVDEKWRLAGTLTDGDIRRNLVRNGSILDNPVGMYMCKDFTFIREAVDLYPEIRTYFEKGIELLPVLNSNDEIIEIYDLNITKAVLPIDVVIMAGGEGIRLRPFTDHTPKPMLNIGNKPIIEHNLDRLIRYGIKNFNLSVRYLADQIIEYLGDGKKKRIHIHYVKEDEPLGTMGSISLIENFENDFVLLTNSDILTTLDYADFFYDFVNKSADMSIVTVPYHINVPYAVLDIESDVIKACREKPEYTFQTNAGIYLMKRELLKDLKKNGRLDVTDFVDKLIESGKKVVSYPFWGYWVDIGKQEDFSHAQKAISILEDF